MSRGVLISATSAAGVVTTARRRLAAALAFLLFASTAPAFGQIYEPSQGPSGQSNLALIAPTAPAAANNNQIATTAWVKLQSYLTGNQTITLSGDCAGSGAMSIVSTCTKTNGVAFAASATTDTTQAGGFYEAQ
ncbi:hypothetical protein [Bradyrhizobium sp. Ash2021]|uniref:hypothetical protein n=1 Tax=Bradyrhizobium sp. Ash2021 TaxID=2954771 RepID=UPI002815BFA0|nr:hypothetical protein [Bradyrhizobium sp. Ash2021]WMT78748.1 hypothetical protein NL528_21455 [Bradyrhizobium sp. Ash2021]